MLWDPFLLTGLHAGLQSGALRQPFPTFPRARGLRQLLDTAWDGPTAAGLALDVRSDDDCVRVRAELPGLGPEDLELTIEGELLTLSGAFPAPFEKEDAARSQRTERPRGAFRQTLELPYRVDATASQARLERGLLELVLPRAEETKAVRIPVQTPDSVSTERS